MKLLVKYNRANERDEMAWEIYRGNSDTPIIKAADVDSAASCIWGYVNDTEVSGVYIHEISEKLLNGTREFEFEVWSA